MNNLLVKVTGATENCTQILVTVTEAAKIVINYSLLRVTNLLLVTNNLVTIQN